MKVARWIAREWRHMAALRSSATTGFVSMWLFVGLVSSYDGWLVVRYWDSIVQLERNPVCRYLIVLGEGDAMIFLRAKTSGTLAVLSVLAGLYRSNRRLAFPVVAAVSAFQFGLLLYLMFAESS